jgi:acyl-CoA synthetase (AMP-forming)/AMP-acid ligase II
VNHEAKLLHEFIFVSAERDPHADALNVGDVAISYAELCLEVRRFAGTLSALEVGRGERVAIYLEKRREAVVASFGAPAHGAVFVPINPLLKPDQVGYILRDCGVRVLVCSPGASGR